MTANRVAEMEIEKWNITEHDGVEHNALMVWKRVFSIFLLYESFLCSKLLHQRNCDYFPVVIIGSKKLFQRSIFGTNEFFLIFGASRWKTFWLIKVSWSEWFIINYNDYYEYNFH